MSITSKLNPTCVLAFSGGLDTSFCVPYLNERGFDVITASINTGGFDTVELARIGSLSKQLGAIKHVAIDAKALLWQDYLRYLIFGNVLRGQLYPLSVSAERVCQAKLVAEVAIANQCSVICHGSTGAGNDQVRFDVAFRVLIPGCTLITPIREHGFSREHEQAVLATLGIVLPARTQKYSVNEGLWGTSVGGAETHDSWAHLPESAYPGGEIDSNQVPVDCVIDFEKGVPTFLNGQVMDPVTLIEALNALGSGFGIGRGIHLGDTILGIKGRVGFEAPAAHLLITAHRELEKLTLSGKQLYNKEQMGALYGSLLHEGHYFDPLARDLEAYLTSSQDRVTGAVRLKLRPYCFQVEGVRSPHSLMQSKVASYGESANAWTGAEAAGFCKLFGVGQQVALSVIPAKAGIQVPQILG